MRFGFGSAAQLKQQFQRFAMWAGNFMECDDQLQAFQQFCHRGVQAPSDNLQCNEPNLASAAFKV